MKKVIFITVIAGVIALGGCVESSSKYKALQVRVDSLSNVSLAQNSELENVLADINDISAGMQSLREAEHILALESAETNQAGNKTKQQLNRLKTDIQAISDAIGNYKEQIKKLEGKNSKQSAEFKKLIAGLNEELEVRSQRIAEITAQLAEKDKQLAVKTQQITDLNQNVETLDKETKSQKMTIAEQDQTIHLANYLLGSRKELKDAQVISRQGIFCPPIVSSQAQKADFTQIDIREMKSIPLNDKKAKVLSVHPADSYTLEAGEDGNLVLKISDENAFWKQTKYLVVMVG